MKDARAGRRLRVLGCLALLCLLVMAVSLCVGAVKISPGDLWDVLTGAAEHRRYQNVIWNLRLPRVLLGVSVGAALSVAGALMQGLFRNPLADPGLVGVSGGAALGAVFIIVLGGTFFPGIAILSDYRMLPIAAFLGGMAVTFLIRRLSMTNGYMAVTTILLVGVAVNAVVGSVIGFATFLATDTQLRSLSFWTLGSLGGANWQVVSISTPVCLGLAMLAPLSAGVLNAIALGEAEAGHLGFSVERAKSVLIVGCALAVGACVAFTGMIAFVGLVVPHCVRLMLGPDHRGVIPGSALLGATVLVGADTIARTLVAPAELPIGILTAAFGGPYFLILLLRQRRKALWG